MFPFRPAEVSATSKRPVLRQPSGAETEVILQVQSHVGLYEKEQRREEFDDGTLYLTPYRLIWVDASPTQNRAFQLSLSTIFKLGSYTGFLRSHPKIIIHLLHELSSEPVPALSTSSPSSNIDPTQSKARWKCPICAHENSLISHNNSLQRCDECGVKSEVRDLALICTTCTFINTNNARQCEMCVTAFFEDISVQVQQLSMTSPSTALASQDETYIKFSFRSGGHTAFYECLREAMSAKVWEVHGLTQKISFVDRYIEVFL